MGDKGPLLNDCAPLLSAHMARARLSDPLPFQVQRKVDALVRRYPARARVRGLPSAGVRTRRARINRCRRVSSATATRISPNRYRRAQILTFSMPIDTLERKTRMEVLCFSTHASNPLSLLSRPHGDFA